MLVNGEGPVRNRDLVEPGNKFGHSSGVGKLKVVQPGGPEGASHDVGTRQGERKISPEQVVVIVDVPIVNFRMDNRVGDRMDITVAGDNIVNGVANRRIPIGGPRP